MDCSVAFAVRGHPSCGTMQAPTARFTIATRLNEYFTVSRPVRCCDLTWVANYGKLSDDLWNIVVFRLQLLLWLTHRALQREIVVERCRHLLFIRHNMYRTVMATTQMHDAQHVNVLALGRKGHLCLPGCCNRGL